MFALLAILLLNSAESGGPVIGPPSLRGMVPPSGYRQVQVSVRPAATRYEVSVGGRQAVTSVVPILSTGEFRIELPQAGAWDVLISGDGKELAEIANVPVVESTDLPLLKLGDVLPEPPARPVAVLSWHKPRTAGAPADLAGTSAVLASFRLAGSDGRPAPRVLGFISGTLISALSAPDGMLTLPTAHARPSTVQFVSPTGERGRYEALAGVREATGPFSIPLTPSSTLRGRVIDAASGLPVPAALVWSQDETGVFALASSSGEYVLHSPGPIGKAHLNVAAPGYEPAVLTHDLTAAREQLAEPARLARTVAITGAVVDPEGRPVGDALVAAHTAGESPESAKTARSDGTGHFRISGLPGAPARLGVSAQGFAPTSLDLPASPPLGWPLQRIVLRRGVILTGIVQARAGDPVPDARVDLLPAGDQELLARAEDRALPSTYAGPSTTTSRDGRFELLGKPGDVVALVVTHPRFAPTTEPEISLPAASGTVDVGILRLEPGAVICGAVRDRDGVPIPSAQVVLKILHFFEKRLEVTTGFAPQGLATDAQGVSCFGGLRPGQPGMIWAMAPRYLEGSASALAREEAKNTPIALERALRVSGRVVTGDGSPIPNAAVVARRPASLPSAPLSVGTGVGTTYSNPLGEFTIDGVGSDSVEVRAAAEGYSQATILLDRPLQEDVEDLEFVLHEGSEISGRVFTTNGQPVLGATVSLGPSSTVSDGAGAFLLRGLPSGTQTLTVRHPDYATAAQQVDLPEGGSVQTEITLAAGVSVGGRVTEGSGGALAGPWVTMTAVAGRGQPRHIRGAEDGSFAFSNVAPGTYLLVAKHRDFALDARATIEVASTPVDDVPLVFQQGAAVIVTVRGGQQTSAGPIIVEIRNSLGVKRAARQTGPSEYRLDNLQLGGWIVSAWLPSSGRKVEQAVGSHFR